MKSGSLSFLEPSGPLQACNGIALPILGITVQSKHGAQYPHTPSAIRPDAHSALVARLQTARGVGMEIKVAEKAMTDLNRGC
jgi:hypothetical protein